MITPSFSLTATERVLPKLALDFTTASLDPRVTFTRALNTATVVNSSGYVVGINADLPRFDYDPVTLVCKGLLIEESRTNGFTYSEDFSAVGWATTRASIAVDQATAPSNTLTGDKLIEDTSTNTHFLTRSSFSFTSGTSYSLSIYLQAAGRSQIRITSGNTTTWPAGATFNLATGAIISTAFGTAQIQNAGNGWYRCTISGAAGATAATSVNFVLSNGTSESYTGNGVSGVHLWGAQMEVGAFATSYIPNLATGTTTRNADVATMTGTNFSDWYNQDEGTLCVNYTTPKTAASFAATLYQDATRYMAITAANGGGTAITVFDGTSQASIGTRQTTSNIAFGYKTNSFAVSQNAAAVSTDNLGTVPSGITALYIGNFGSGALYLSGTISSIRFYSQRLLNAELQAVSK